MKKEIYLQIPEPCHENWDAMLPAEKGRFCKSCEKEVVDFSVMTDKEILRVISKSSSGTCARISSDQLDKPLIKEVTPIINPHKFFLSAFIPAFLFAGKATSQNTLKTNVVSVNKPDVSYNMLGGLIAYSASSITGSVILADGTPATDAVITIVENNKTTKADKYGRFSIAYPQDQTKVTLQVVSAGYVKEVEVERDKIKPLHIKLLTPALLMGKTSFNPGKVDAKNTDLLSKTQPKVIYGKVEDENGDALSNATIHLNSINKTTQSDPDGKFAISYNGNEMFTEITTSYVGYEPVTTRVELTGKNIYGVVMKTRSSTKMGEVTVASYPKKACTIIMGRIASFKKVTVADTARKVIAKVFKNEMFKVFPNPVAKGGALQIAFSQQGSYTLQLLDNTGKLYLIKEIQGEAKQPSQILMPANISAGTYYIKAIDKRTNKQFVDKIVIQ